MRGVELLLEANDGTLLDVSEDADVELSFCKLDC
jgi:hypothetical protein